MKTTHTPAGRLLKKIITGLAIITLLAWNLNCFAQDTLVKRKGEVILSKIIEVSESRIIYKRTDNLTGPDYVADKNDLAFIKYSNGVVDCIPVKQSVVAINQPEQVAEGILTSGKIIPYGQKFLFKNKTYSSFGILGMMKKVNDPKINVYLRKARTAKGIGPVCFAAIPVALLGFTLMSSQPAGSKSANNNANIGTALILVASSGIGVAITLKSIERKSTAAAIKLYNENY